ncbi:MAG: phosphate ABC transporter substrate-binding protein [Haliea sp.]
MFLGSGLLAASVRAELVVIMHPDSALPSLSRQAIVNIFMGRHFRLPGGGAVVPVDNQCCREQFYRDLVDKTLPEINSYWARLVFSGRGSPPQKISTDAEMLDLVSQNPGVIGYVERSVVDARVTVVYALSP